jgi:predicted HAD superfamily Cof-like phosphohydrolase
VKIRDQVTEFHRAFGVPVHETPRVPSDDRVRLRLRLIAEEFCELLDAAGLDDYTCGAVRNLLMNRLATPMAKSADIVAVADAFTDIDYVVEGSRLEFGIDGEPIAAEVHRSNLAKVGATIREDGKILKPPTWTPPDIAGELRKQGWLG